MKYKVGLLSLLSILFISSCEKKSNDNSSLIHPVDENIPHFDSKAEMLNISNSIDDIEELPIGVQTLHQILNDNSIEYDVTELNMLISNKIDISSLNDSTLLILDKKQDLLTMYNLTTQESEIVANQGRGPGDLFYVEELSLHKEKAYISMQGFRISIFNCQTEECEHEKIIPTSYNNYALAPTENFIYFLGLSSIGRDQNNNSVNKDASVIHKANMEGEIETSFLPNYNDSSPLLRNQIMDRGYLEAYPDLDKIIVGFYYFPYLFSYNSNGKFLGKFEIPEFIRAKNIKNITSGGTIETIRSYDGDYTHIHSQSKLKERWLFVKLQHFREIEYSTQEDKFTGKNWFSYKLFDVESNKMYNIGKDKIYPYGQNNIYHIINGNIFQNRDGKLIKIDITE